jgi:O-acetyl-ADP-ribose deacetylase (regulator of RNase III)
MWRGDMTKLAIDAIVNAANNTLLGGGGACSSVLAPMCYAAYHDSARLCHICTTTGMCSCGAAPHSACIDGAIHRAAGRALRQEVPPQPLEYHALGTLTISVEPVEPVALHVSPVNERRTV